MKNTLLNCLKQLPIKSRVVKKEKNTTTYRMAYAPRALSLGMIGITPEPSRYEIAEAREWLEKKDLLIPMGEGELKFLIKN